MNYFGNNLKLLIKNKKISGKEVAERIGKSESTITAYVNGTNPTLDILIKLCDIFQIDLNNLATDCNQTPGHVQKIECTIFIGKFWNFC